jgi:hypothetical protein
MRKRLSPGVVLGVIALVVGMSGSAWAAAKITGASVKDGSLTGRDIKNYSIGANKLSDGAATSLAGDTGPQGPGGPAGPAGPAGPPGPSALGALTVVSSPQTAFLSTDVVKAATAYCPAGQRVVSGGGVSISDEQIAASEALADRTGWFVIGIDLADDGGEYVQAQALCAPTGMAVAARAPSRARDTAKVAALVDRFRASACLSGRAAGASKCAAGR